MKVPKNVLTELELIAGREETLMASELAEHAHNEAMSALDRITKSAADREVQIMATLMALRLLEETVEHNMQLVRKAVAEARRAGR